MRIIGCLISSLFLASTDYYSFKKLNKKNLKTSDKIIIFLILFATLSLNGIFQVKYLKSILMLFFFYIINKYIYKNNTKNSLLYCFYTFLYSLVAEIMFTCCFMLFNKELNIIEYSSTFLGMIVSNFLISFIMYLLLQIKNIYNFLVNFEENISYIKERDFVIYLVTIFITSYILFILVYFKYYTSKILVYVIISLMFFVYTLIFIHLLNSINKYNNEKEKYTLSIKSLLEYEDILDKYRVANHENKNNLLMLGRMTNIKDVKKYVDQILELKEEDNTSLFSKVAKIPEGGLRAVIYSKLVEMEDKKINYSLLIDRKIKVKYFIEMSSKDSLEICNILNVFIDNAIQYVCTTDNPTILIEMSLLDNNDLEMDISNNCTDKVNISDITNKGFTTKGEGHGYGLNLVSNIVKSNSNLKNETSLENEVFTQKLIIKKGN